MYYIQNLLHFIAREAYEKVSFQHLFSIRNNTKF